MKFTIVALTGLWLISTPLFADEDAALWGAKELLAASQASTEALREHAGQSAYDAISALSIERSSQGNSAKAKLTYMVGSEKKTASYFCHAHGDAIDCH